MTDEEKLVREAQRGDIDAFTSLLHSYENRLKNTDLCPLS